VRCWQESKTAPNTGLCPDDVPNTAVRIKYIAPVRPDYVKMKLGYGAAGGGAFVEMQTENVPVEGNAGRRGHPWAWTLIDSTLIHKVSNDKLRAYGWHRFWRSMENRRVPG